MAIFMLKYVFENRHQNRYRSVFMVVADILEDELLPVLMSLVSILSSLSGKNDLFKISSVRYLTVGTWPYTMTIIQGIFNQSCEHWSDWYIDQHCEADWTRSVRNLLAGKSPSFITVLYRSCFSLRTFSYLFSLVIEKIIWYFTLIFSQLWNGSVGHCIKL